MISGLRPHGYGHNHEQDQHPGRILEPWAGAHEFAHHHSQPDQWAENLPRVLVAFRRRTSFNWLERQPKNDPIVEFRFLAFNLESVLLFENRLYVPGAPGGAV
jgi:hypothetical protein